MQNKKIPLIYSSMPSIEEYIEEIRSIWDTHWLTNMGPKHEEFRTKLKNYLKVKNIDLLTNGHMALELAIQALELKGEVITTPFTFASTTHAIVRNGLTPVFCDINSKDFTIDESKIESLITDKTTAIVPVHVYGNICNVEEIERIANKYDLKVIYDAAHTFGEEYKGKGVGTFGDVSCFSFHATKVFNSIEGGAVCFNDDKLVSKFESLKNFGINGSESVDYIGANAKMNEFSAAMGICNLRHIEQNIEKRKLLVERYIENLDNINGIIVNKVNNDVKSNYSYFPIVINEKVFGKSRDELYELLLNENIETRKYFYPLTSEFECYKGVYDSNTTPVAKYISERVLTLPLYADLTLEDVDYICKTILAFKG